MKVTRCNDYFSYTHNFSAISKKMRKGCPAIEAKRLERDHFRMKRSLH
jgi:hypothetical protein